MERNNGMSAILKLSVAFGTVYVLIWFFPGIVVYPSDYLVELYQGVEYVDGWTPGMMVWTGALIVIPALFLISLAIVFFKARGKKHA